MTQEDDYGGEIFDQCYGVEQFSGSWYQPLEADEYSDVFRLSAEDEIYTFCARDHQRIESASNKTIVLQGASVLTASTGILLAIAMLH